MRKHKIPRENTAGNFTDIGLSNVFVDLTPKARPMSQYKQIWGYIKLKNSVQ